MYGTHLLSIRGTIITENKFSISLWLSKSISSIREPWRSDYVYETLIMSTILLNFFLFFARFWFLWNYQLVFTIQIYFLWYSVLIFKRKLYINSYYVLFIHLSNILIENRKNVLFFFSRIFVSVNRYDYRLKSAQKLILLLLLFELDETVSFFRSIIYFVLMLSTIFRTCTVVSKIIHEN